MEVLVSAKRASPVLSSCNLPEALLHTVSDLLRIKTDSDFVGQCLAFVTPRV